MMILFWFAQIQAKVSRISKKKGEYKQVLLQAMEEYAEDEAMITPEGQEETKKQARRKMIIMNSNLTMKVVHILAVLR